MQRVAANVAGMVYGTIVVGAVLAAEAAQRETYAETIGGVVLAVLLYTLAHAYARSATQRLRDKRPLTVTSVRDALVSELAILAGAALPLLALILSGIAGAKLSTALAAGLWTSVALIVLIEFAAGFRAGARGRELATQTAVGVVLGLLVVAMRAVMH
jgi:hypothetical protein